MRYKVRFGNGLDMFAICYADNQADAVAEFHKYHPNLTVTTVEEFPQEPLKVDLYDLIGEPDPEEAIQYLLEAIEDAGVEHRVAGYLRRHGFGREDECDE